MSHLSHREKRPHFLASLSAVLLVVSCALPAGAQLREFFSATGQVSLSVDGAGSLDSFHVAEALKPSDTAEVLAAFVLAAGSFGRFVESGDVTIDDLPIAWQGNAFHGNDNEPLFFHNVAADVTALVKEKIDAAPAGRISFVFTENGSETIDGEVLVVVFSDPEQEEERTVSLLFGAPDLSGLDSFDLTFAEPCDPDAPGAMLDFGLGIAFSPVAVAGAEFFPVSFVDVDGQRLTTSAGGEDDGSSLRGSWITVGGLDDSNANPEDPFLFPTGDPRGDDELYSLLPFIEPGATGVRVDLGAATPGNNPFFAYFVTSKFLVVEEGLFLRPETAVRLLGTQHTLTATAIDNEGLPFADTALVFNVFDGPNAGTTGVVTTDDNGIASFTYRGVGGVGTDSVVVSFQQVEPALKVGFEGEVSNLATVQWILPSGLAPDVATSPDGEALVLFEEGDSDLLGVFAAVVGFEGDAPRIVTQALLNEGNTEGDQRSPAVAWTGDGTWAAFYLDGQGSPNVLVGQLVDRQGLLGEPFVVDDSITCDRGEESCALTRPDVAGLGDGSFVVAWERGDNVFARLYGPAAVSMGEPFQVATASSAPAVAGFDDGSFAVLFAKSGGGVRLARFDAMGAAAARGSVSRFNGGGPGNPAAAVVDGRLAAVWQTGGGQTGEGVFGRLDVGDFRSPEVQVNTEIDGDQVWPAIVRGADGLVFVAWLDRERQQLVGQRLSAGSVFVGGEVVLSPAPGGLVPTSPGRPRIDALPDGRIVVVASTDGTEDDPDGTFFFSLVAPSDLGACFDGAEFVCLKSRAVPRWRLLEGGAGLHGPVLELEAKEPAASPTVWTFR